MSLPPGHPRFTGRRHTIAFRINDAHAKDPVRPVEVHATPEEIRFLAEQGYLVREALLPSAMTDRLRTAVDEVVTGEGKAEKLSGTKRYGGVFLRHLMDKHEAFHELLTYQPVVSVARAILGPAIWSRGLSARVAYPGEGDQQTEWHFHQRVVPSPAPPWFMHPQTLDALIYLDAADDANGPFAVRPGSHRWHGVPGTTDDYGDQPDQVVIRVPPGGVVFTHGSLWHRGLPTTAAGTVRRLLLYGLGPCWMRRSIYEDPPADGLTKRLLARRDLPAEVRELLGDGGYM